jgi:hypothetical protein
MTAECKRSSGKVNFELDGNKGNISSGSGMRMGGENIQDVKIKISSGTINFNNN